MTTAQPNPAAAAARRPIDEALVLKIERHFDAPPSLVFRSFSDARHLGRWFGPKGFTIREAKADCRPGGAYRIVMESPAGSQHKLRGTYREVELDVRLVFTWAWEDDAGAAQHETLVAIDLQPSASGTRLTLFQHQFESQEARDQHQSGWGSTLDCLGEYLPQIKEQA